MAIRKLVCLAVLICSAWAQVAFGQEGRFAPVPNSDPFVLSSGSSFSASGPRPTRGPAVSREAISADLSEALQIISRNHIGGKQLDTQALTGSAITSMLHTLDPHSNYYDPNQFQELLGEHESEYSGTGSSIAGFERDGRSETFVLSTFPGSPAAKAGLKFGDRIIAVDGRTTAGSSPDAVRDLVRGKRGTSVRVTIERAGTGVVETVEIKRDRVHEPAVPKGFLIGPNVGYIDLTKGFSNATFSEFETTLTELDQAGMRSLVLDIRGNGGGILEQAVKVAEKFLPYGTTIVSQKGRYSDDLRTWKAGKAGYGSMPLVLLIDENSASASEVLAGALQDNDRALLIGQKTFGKGLVQNVLNLPEGAGLTLTAARYYTPTGRSIQREYSESGLYNYYNHRQAVEIDKPVFAAKTITDRVVYGGDGITPDVPTAAAPLTPEQLGLLDPVFFFVREVAAGKKISRQNTASGGTAVDEELFNQFAGFVRSSGSWPAATEKLEKEKAFVSGMLGYYLAMAAKGVNAANRSRIESDPQVAQAVKALPKAGRLAATAQKARLLPKKEKSSLSLVLNEPR